MGKQLHVVQGTRVFTVHTQGGKSFHIGKQQSVVKGQEFSHEEAVVRSPKLLPWKAKIRTQGDNILHLGKQLSKIKGARVFCTCGRRSPYSRS